MKTSLRTYHYYIKKKKSVIRRVYVYHIFSIRFVNIGKQFKFLDKKKSSCNKMLYFWLIEVIVQVGIIRKKRKIIGGVFWCYIRIINNVL